MNAMKPLLILLTVLLPLSGFGNPDEFCGIKNRVLRSGEHLNFRVYYNLSALWVPAGEADFRATLKQLKGKNVYHIVGTGRTYSSYDWIFKVRDKYQTYLDAETMMPLRFLRDVNEGGYSFKNEVSFNRNTREAYSDNKTFKVPACVQDVLSAIYYARNIDYKKYKPGDKIPFSLFLDNEVYHIYIRYLGKERITTRYGTFNTIKIAPLLIQGTIFEGGEDMRVWVSDDENHIPVRVDSPILVGSIKVDLMGYSNLKHPLTALISKR